MDALSVNISININFKVGTLVTSGEDALRKGKEGDLKKVGIVRMMMLISKVAMMRMKILGIGLPILSKRRMACVLVFSMIKLIFQLEFLMKILKRPT